MGDRGDRGAVRAMTAGALGIAVLLGMSACGDPEERSLCTVFDTYLESRAKIAAIDPESTTAAEAAEIANDHQEAVAALTQATDGRYAAAVGTLDAAMNDLVAALDSVDDEADYTVWLPLVEDSLEAVRDASAQLEDVIGPSCVPEGSDAPATSVEPTPTTDS